LGALEEQHRRYGDRVAFLIVYIREAHPEDGWVLEENREDGIALRDPVSAAERAEVAATCAVRLTSSIPMVVDGPDDRVGRAYGGWPDRLYLIGADGRIAYQGGEGPYGFLPDELEDAIRHELTVAEPSRDGRDSGRF
jgi:hypothetical protein